jgi:hypothetical protein
MKKFATLALLLLTACHPKFKAGDCINSTHVEAWQAEQQFKVHDVGRDLYRLVWWNEAGEYSNVERLSIEASIDDVDSRFERIACPK